MDARNCPDGIPFEISGNGRLWSGSHLGEIIDERLRRLVLDHNETPQLLQKAISYSLLSPGKRLRPIITLLTSFHFGRRDLGALDCACALEMIHAASIVMDDLPAMDDAEMRRGQQTLHRAFGEDVAVLSSIALLNLAFGVVAASDSVSPATRADVALLLSRAVGANGLIGGQLMDLRMRSSQTTAGELQRINETKTAALFAAAAEAGARVAGASDEMMAPVRGFATELGLAFQIADDALDGTCHAGRTGKDTGKDAGKPTLATVLGEGGARQMFVAHAAQCRGRLAEIGAAGSALGLFVEDCLLQVQL
jgi:geranylgeranyl diphosphate synthase type II